MKVRTRVEVGKGLGRRVFLQRTGLAAAAFTGLGLLAGMNASAGTLLRGDGSEPGGA
ncbi:MAG: hypothetical protein WAK48_07850 [Candidatus Acidiferrum sp.]